MPKPIQTKEEAASRLEADIHEALARYRKRIARIEEEESQARQRAEAAALAPPRMTAEDIQKARAEKRAEARRAYYEDGLRVTEVAERVGLSLPTVRKAIQPIVELSTDVQALATYMSAKSFQDVIGAAADKLPLTKGSKLVDLDCIRSLQKEELHPRAFNALSNALPAFEQTQSP